MGSEILFTGVLVRFFDAYINQEKVVKYLFFTRPTVWIIDFWQFAMTCCCIRDIYLLLFVVLCVRFPRTLLGSLNRRAAIGVRWMDSA